MRSQSSSHERKVRIFLSSTFLDLEEHRRSVDEIINRLSQDFCGMEYFGARPFEPKKVSLDEIKSSDIFIGVYAHRYGWIPDGNTYSITELEFDFALSQGIPCFCYIVDDNHAWLPKFIDNGIQAKKLTKFKKKVSKLVRSNFTTPDNLAKQISADLSKNIDVPDYGTKTLADICKLTSEWRLQEIKTNIGPKYIAELFVDRKLTKKLTKKYLSTYCNDAEIRKYINSVIEYCSIFSPSTEVSKYLSDLVESNKKAEEEKKQSDSTEDSDEKKDKEENEYLSLQQTFHQIRDLIEELSRRSSGKVESYKPYYPALLFFELIKEVEDTIKTINSIRGKLFAGFPKEKAKLESLKKILEKYRYSSLGFIRPINLIVDRAGGGKTNALCHLSNTLGNVIPTFFLTAKAIPEATDDAIFNYISSSYQFVSNPLEFTLEKCEKNGSFLLIVIDGINEHYDPRGFNSALQAFIRRYYNRPIRYLITCRDIYWRFFEDNWWSEHCDEIIRDELYVFNNNEFKKALPLYLRSYWIDAEIHLNAKKQLQHPLLLRFFCEAYKGSHELHTSIGVLRDVRLTPLFALYCERKYRQIQDRLWLSTSSEIEAFVRMLGLLMLREKSRLLPFDAVKSQASSQFGTTSMTNSKSLYVQILDEDIIIEQIPSNSLSKLQIEFVYDEFMEYVIAKALFFQLGIKVKSPSLDDILELANSLLRQEEQFVSIAGILVFVGEMTGEISLTFGLRYIDWIVAQGRGDLACRIISRWPEATMSKKVISKLIALNHEDNPIETRNHAWKTMEERYWRYWKSIYEYITGMQAGGFFRNARIFSFLNKTDGGVTLEEKFKSVLFIKDRLESRPILTKFGDSADYKSAITAAKNIIDRNSERWSTAQRQELNDVLNHLKSSRSG